MLSVLADWAGIASFIMSIVLFILSRSIFKDSLTRRKEYNNDRLTIKIQLIALRDNILEDQADSIKIRSSLRQALYSYRSRYWFVLSPLGVIHIHLSLRYVTKSSILPSHREPLCKHLDYLIGTLDRKEIISHE